MSKTEYYKELLKIYRELLKKHVDGVCVLDLYVEYLKLCLKMDYKNPHYSKFAPGFTYGNCYTYALDFKVPSIFRDIYILTNKRDIYYDVGFISCPVHDTYVTSRSKLIEYFYQDCDYLKICVFECGYKDNPSHGGYKIHMFIDPKTEIGKSYDFHFVRENVGGILSDKNGCNGEIERIYTMDTITKHYDYVKTLEIVKPNVR